MIVQEMKIPAGVALSRTLADASTPDPRRIGVGAGLGQGQGGERRRHPARVSDAQREEIWALLGSTRFCDLAPAQV